ncbi:hypothetical protein [Sphingobacterium paucimobilis]|uniref:hypothetical protein n=1 Tax=Sphingobacterium paucimobilis TaxID=1385985 RepID=UPI00130DC907|nr:hypothetical protein [Sphingobacterium paucimobilis]
MNNMQRKRIYPSPLPRQTNEHRRVPSHVPMVHTGYIRIDEVQATAGSRLSYTLQCSSPALWHWRKFAVFPARRYTGKSKVVRPNKESRRRVPHVCYEQTRPWGQCDCSIL